MKGEQSELNSTALAVMNEKMINVEKDMGEIKVSLKELIKKIDDNYVTKNEFQPVKSVVYGLVTIVLLAVVGAVVGLVILK